MKSMFLGKRQKCLCAFCGHSRKIYIQKRANGIHIILSVVISLMFMWSVWQKWELRAGLVFIICITAIEISIHFRWRLSLICRQCGFDPLMYLKNHQKAALKVKGFLDRRKLDPSFLTAPAIRVPKRDLNKKIVPNSNIPQVSAKKSQGQFISRSI